MAKTPEYWQQKAVSEVGGDYVNTIFEIAFGYGTYGGEFHVAFNGVPTTVPFPCSDAQFQALLETNPFVQVGGVLVTGTIGGPFELEMIGGNLGRDVAPPTVDGSDLLPFQEVEVQLLARGRTNYFSREAPQMWEDFAEDAKSDKHRFLLLKDAFLEKLLAQAADDVDTRTGDGNVSEAKLSQRYNQLADRQRVNQGKIDAELRTLNAGSRASAGGYIQTKTTNGLPYGQMNYLTPTGKPR